MINTGNINNVGSTGIAVNNNASTISADAGSYIFISNFGTIVAGSNAQPNGQPTNGIWAGFGKACQTNTWGTVVIDNNADVTASAGAGAGISGYNNGNGNVTINEGPDTTVTGYSFGIMAAANNRGSRRQINGDGSTTSGDVTINLSQNAIVEATSTSTVAGTNSYGLFAQNFNNQEGNITINMAAGELHRLPRLRHQRL